MRTFSGSLRRSTVAHFARKVRGANIMATKHELKIQQSHSPEVLTMFATCSWPSLCEQSELQCWRRNRRLCGPARAESPTSLQPRATPWVPYPHSLRPVRAKVKVNRLSILLPLQGVGVYILIPRALPWAENWLPFQGAPFRALFVYHVRHRRKRPRANIRRKSEAKHCSSLCSQSEGANIMATKHELKIQQSHAPKR